MMVKQRDDGDGVNETTQTWAKQAWKAATALTAALGAVLRAFWSVARAPTLFVLNILAALIVLFEEWGWRPLSNLLARLARYRPIAALERIIAKAPPYAALLVFALPTTLLLPLKLVAMWLLANGQVGAATALFIGAKIASTALIARIFLLTKPALMRIPWFARAYGWFMPWKDHLFAIIRASWVWRYGRMVKTRAKLEAGRAWRRWGPRVRPWIDASAARARTVFAGFKARLFGGDAS